MKDASTESLRAGGGLYLAIGLIACSSSHAIEPDVATDPAPEKGTVAEPLSPSSPGGGGDGGGAGGAPPIPLAPAFPACPNGGNPFGQAAGCWAVDPCLTAYADPNCGTFTANNDFPPAGASALGTETITCGACPSGSQCGGYTVAGPGTTDAPPYTLQCQPSLTTLPNGGPDCPSNHWCIQSCTSAQSGQTVKALYPSGEWTGLEQVCP